MLALQISRLINIIAEQLRRFGEDVDFAQMLYVPMAAVIKFQVNITAQIDIKYIIRLVAIYYFYLTACDRQQQIYLDRLPAPFTIRVLGT